MGKSIGRLFCLILALLSTGAVAQVVLTYPKSETTNIFVSKDTVSTWTETAAQDYLIPNSQVFVTGLGSGTAKYLGLLGVAIDRSNNQTALDSVGDSFRQNFAAELIRILKAKLSSRSPTQLGNIVDTTETAQLTLLPSAKLSVSKDNTARLSFRLTVRFVDAITNSEVKKEFHYLHGSTKNLLGTDSWSDQDAKPLRTVSTEALGKIADVLLDDLAGSLSKAFDQDMQRFVNYSIAGMDGKVIRALLLKEDPDHIAVVPIFGERIPRGIVLILERHAIVLQRI